MQKNSIVDSQRGFTLLNTLFAFAVFLLMISFLPYVIKLVKTEIPVTSHKMDVFFAYIQKEIVSARQLSTSGSTLYLNMDDGTSVSYEKYSTNIRRTVNGVGNEILLQNVYDVHYELVENGVIVTVEAAGKRVKKRLSMAPRLLSRSLPSEKFIFRSGLNVCYL